MKTTVIFKNLQTTFQAAIKLGFLSMDKNSQCYAHDYMYMHSDDSHDYFKHSITRKYTKVPTLPYDSNTDTLMK